MLGPESVPAGAEDSTTFFTTISSFSVCGSRAVVHIQVKDVNEFAPTFKEPAYKAVVTEGKIYDSILQVEAVDEDCSPQYSQICNYEIVTTDVPFAIDRNGECPERTLVGGRETPTPHSEGQVGACMCSADDAPLPSLV